MVVTGLTVVVFAGNAHELDYTVLDQDTAGSPPKDLTGISARWAASRFAASGDFGTAPVLSKDSVNGSGQVDIYDPTNGKLRVKIAEGDTAALAGDFYMELELYIPSTMSLVVSTGTMTVNRNVVNP